MRKPIMTPMIMLIALIVGFFNFLQLFIILEKAVRNDEKTLISEEQTIVPETKTEEVVKPVEKTKPVEKETNSIINDQLGAEHNWKK